MKSGFLCSVFEKKKKMLWEEVVLGGHGGFTVEASEIQQDRNVSEIIRCSKTLMWEKEMEQMSFPGSRSSDFHDILTRLPCVVHQQSMWSSILTILIGGCVFRHINLSSYILHCWVHKLALLFLHLWDYKGFLHISKQKLTDLLMACRKQMKLEFSSFYFDNYYWYEV